MKFRKLFLPIVLLTSFVSGCSVSINVNTSTPSTSESTSSFVSSSASSDSSIATIDIITEEGKQEFNGYYSKINNSLTGGMDGTLRTTLSSFFNS